MLMGVTLVTQAPKARWLASRSNSASSEVQ